MSKIILITGASTGIGAATALSLAPENQVLIHYNSSKKEAEKVAELVNARGGVSHLIQADLSSEKGCKNVADFVKHQFGKLDVLINNVGGLVKQHSSQEITWDFLDKLFSLNTFSAMYLSSLCVPLLQQGVKPNVVNITSAIIRSGGTVHPMPG